MSLFESPGIGVPAGRFVGFVGGPGPVDPVAEGRLPQDAESQRRWAPVASPSRAVASNRDAPQSAARWSWAPVYLGVLCLLSYGILLPLLGFYWDDWPITWYSRVLGPGEIRYLESFRPLAGWWYALLRPVLGELPIRWQAFNLANRWLLAWATWWTLQKLWPDRANLALWTAALLAVYPGFGPQFVSVSTSRHFLGLLMFVGSMGLMLGAVESTRRRLYLTLLSILLMILSMLTTDYFYGLETLRPIFLLAVSWREAGTAQQRVGRAMGRWIPYLMVLAVIALWRFVWLEQVFYEIRLPAGGDGPAAEGLSLAFMAEDLWEGGVLGWAKAFEIPTASAIGGRSVWIYRAIVAVAAAGSAGFLFLFGKEGARKSFPNTTVSTPLSVVPIVIGLTAMVAGDAGPWAAGLPVHLNFPSNRLTLPIMLGAALLLSAILSLTRPRLVGVILLSLVVGFSAGRNFWTAVDYRWDWERQKSFVWQLAWRVPGLRAGTTILTDDLPVGFETDNSLTAIVNWIYPPGVVDDKIPFIMYDIENRIGSRFRDLTEGHSIRHEYWTFANGRALVFEGSTSQVLVIYHAYPACLRVVQPVYDGRMPGMPPYVAMAFDLSKPELILQDPLQPAEIPTEILGTEPEHGWCFYYEKADLARQAGDWAQVYILAKAALGLGQSPNHASEYILFLEALGRHGEVAEAKRLTEIVLARAPGLDRMLCDVWDQIILAHPAEDQTRLTGEVQTLLPCVSLSELGGR